MKPSPIVERWSLEIIYLYVVSVVSPLSPSSLYSLLVFRPGGRKQHKHVDNSKVVINCLCPTF